MPRSDSQLEGESNLSASNEQPVFRMGCNEVNTLIPEFDPANSEIFITDWVKYIENLKEARGNRTVLFYATLRLTGAARFWYFSKKNEIKSWPQLKCEIIKSFPSKMDNSSIFLQIMSRRKRENECVESYLYSAAAIAAKIDLSQAATIKYIISGLTDQNLKNVLVASNCNSVNELMVKIKDYEEIEMQNNNRDDLRIGNTKSPRVMRNSTTAPWFATGGHRSMPQKDYQKRTREDDKFQPNNSKRPKMATKRCFKYDQEGHFAASCTVLSKVRNCYKRKKPGDVAKDYRLIGSEEYLHKL